MRKLILTAVMAGLVCLPVFAQFPFGGMMGRGGDGNMMLSSKDVQKELKLTEEQVKTITSAQEEMTKAMRAAFQDGDREAIQKAREEQTKALTKLREGFTPEQKKRFFQLEVQSAAKGNQPAIFSREDVQKLMKFTSEQKEKVKAALSELEKDVKEVFEDAQGDREKMQAAMKKLPGLGKDTFDKIAKSLSDEQKKTWKEIQGEEFKGEFRPAFGFGKGKGKKKDDF
jgi:Spy/CpxP family protein refolding chaperone